MYSTLDTSIQFSSFRVPLRKYQQARLDLLRLPPMNSASIIQTSKNNASTFCQCACISAVQVAKGKEKTPPEGGVSGLEGKMPGHFALQKITG